MVNVKRYVARTAREALAALKAELGADAVVLSNRQVPEGVEIVAMPSEQMGALNATIRQARAPEAPVRPTPSAPVSRGVVPTVPQEDVEDFTVTLGQHIARLAREQAPRVETRLSASGPTPRMPPAALAIRPFNPPHVAEPRADLPLQADELGRNQQPSVQPVVMAEPVAVARSAAAERDSQVVALETANARLMDELGSIKGMLERQLAGFAWGEMARNTPARTQLMGELLEAGFSAELTRRLTEDLPGDAPHGELRNHVMTRLGRHLPLLDSDSDIIDRGGVYALVGPTGVGKTTTTAKLAARCVVRHGADKLALITTDGYRIGAHEQLRIYGRILGVAVHVVRDAADLRRTLQDLRNKHMVLIDTIGMSQRDKMVVEQASMLTSAGCVRRLLVLNATARGDTLDDVLRAYEGPDLAGCVLSKVDEAASLAPVLDVAIRHELQVFYVANGQRVPEDLHVPNRSYLVHRAMRETAADSPWKLGADDACLMMAGRSGQAARRGVTP